MNETNPDYLERATWSETWTLCAQGAITGPSLYHEQTVEVVPKLEAEQAIRNARADERKRIEKTLEALAEEYEARLAKGEWSIFNSREQVAGWGQGVRAALASLSSKEQP